MRHEPCSRLVDGSGNPAAGRITNSHCACIGQRRARPAPIGGVRELDQIGDALRAAAAALEQRAHARQQAEEALRASEERFRLLAESLPQLVWTCLPDGRVDYLSRQWLDYTGMSEGEPLDSQ